MKNTFLFFISLCIGPFLIYGQNTLTKTFSHYATNSIVKSVAYGNSLFYVYHVPANGLIIQKNNLNGDPLIKKAFGTFTLSPQNSLFIHGHNGALFISGCKSTATLSSIHEQPFMIKLDTSTCDIIYANQYPNIGYSFNTINDSRILSNGNLMMTGYSTNTGVDTYGMVLIVSTGTSAAVVESFTCGITGALAQTTLTGAAEVSNSTFLFSAKIASSDYIFRAARTTTGTIISDLIKLSAPLNGITNFSNPKKILGWSDNNIYKIDTSLTTATGKLAANALQYSKGLIYENNRVYRFVNGAKLEILDSSLTSVSANSYTNMVQYNSFPNITTNANNLFLNYGPNPGGQAFHMIKTHYSGQITSCPSNSLSINLAASSIATLNPVNFANMVVAATRVTLSLNTITINVPSTINCTAQAIEENFIEKELKVFPNPNNGTFTLHFDSETNNGKILIINSMGQEVYAQNIAEGKNEIEAKNLARGMYYCLVKNGEETIRTTKILVE